MLFKIERNKSVFDSNPGLRLSEAFACLEDLNDKKMRFVMLVADYKTPLRQHPESKRRELAALEAGYTVQDNASRTIDFRGKKLVDRKDKEVENAIKVYRDIQRDEDRETLEIINQQIENIKEIMNQKTTDVDEMVKRNKLLNSIPDLVSAKKSLSKISDLTDEVFNEETQQVSDKPLSLVDRIQQDEIDSK